MPDSFDSYSRDYSNLVNNAISQTGFNANDMVKAKLKKLSNLFPSLPTTSFDFLDFGCGVGNLYENLSNYFPYANYIGVDSSKESIQRAQSRFDTDEIFQNSDSSRWRSHKYDLIFAAGVFHHIPKSGHAKLIHNLSSLLHKHGILAIWEHNPLNPITLKIVRDCEFDHDAVLVGPNTLKQHIAGAGLIDVEVVYTTFFPKVLSLFEVLDPYLGWLPFGGQYLITGTRL